MDGILNIFRDSAANNPGRELYDFMDCDKSPFGHDVITVKEAWEKSRDIAWELVNKGAKKGDRAIILSMQDKGTVYAIWGCMIAGVVFTVIPPPIDPGKLSRFISVLKSCNPKFLISNEGMEKASETNVTLPLLKKAFREVVKLKRVYTDKTSPHPEFTSCNQYEPQDLIYLQYTSGSTSDPKGVMVTHGNLMGCISHILTFFDFTKGHHNLCSWVPFFHNIGLIIAIFIPIIAPPWNFLFHSHPAVSGKTHGVDEGYIRL